MPIGIDPGGVAVAIAGSGVDYTSAQIASRLARDGEGELIGWDFVDEDRQPFERRLSSDMPMPGTSAATAILADSPGSRLVVFRVRPDLLTYGRVVVFAAKSPARILVLAAGSDKREEWAAFAEAATHFKDLLVVAAAGEQQTYPAALGLDNVLSVTWQERFAPAGGAAPNQISVADLAATSFGLGPEVASARIAALAARIQQLTPGLVGAALKARLLSLAEPLPAPYGSATRHGWIADPAKHFPVKPK